MDRWWWPWSERVHRLRDHDEAVGQVRQDLAVATAEHRRARRSLEAAIEELMATQAERGEEDDDVGSD